jgi:hypothetical protein
LSITLGGDRRAGSITDGSRPATLLQRQLRFSGISHPYL